MILNKKLADNTVILTISSLLISGISMAFQAWLAGKTGTAGIGLFQLIMSVTALAMTFAISGIRFASTRLISEELACGGESIRAATGHCLAYAVFFGTAAGLILYLTAEPIGVFWLGDARTVAPLRLMSFSMPCAAICSAISGYFIAVGRVWKSALAHLIELLTGAALTVYLLSDCQTENIEKSCLAITQGRVTADVMSLVLMGVFFYADLISCDCGKSKKDSFTPRMLKIALPFAFSAYTRSALSTLQHILVPRGLRLSGMSGETALSGYGIIHGMALPAVLFPSCVMSVAAELVVPELTKAQMSGDGEKINSAVGRLMSISFGFSGTVAVLLFLAAEFIGRNVFKSEEAGAYIRLLAPIVPVMYTDMIVDGCLKGLGEQMWNMKVNILDSTLSAALTWHLLPHYALKAYIGIICFTELLNFVLSYLRLDALTRRSLSRGAPASSRRRGGVSGKCVYKEDM